IAQALSKVCIEESFNVAADKSFGQRGEFAANNILREVNGDRIHSDPDEGHAPAAFVPYLDNLIKCRQKQRAISAGDKSVGGGPNFFHDWELKVPKPAGDERRRARAEKINYLF